MTSTLTDRERFVNCLTGQPVDRIPYWLRWRPWLSTLERWKAEGMPADGDDRRLFGADAIPQWVRVNCGPCPKVEYRVVEEDEDSVTYIDPGYWGTTLRVKKGSDAMPQFLKPPIANRDEWEHFKKEHFDPNHPDRLAPDTYERYDEHHRDRKPGYWVDQCQEWMANDWPIQLGEFPDVTLYGGVRWLLGDQDCLIAFADDPELVHDIMNTLTNVFLTVFHQVVKQVRIDVIHIWEDMSGKQGSLISPRHWREFMTPCYRRIKEFAVDYNIPLLSVDTDGYPDDILPTMIDAGVNYWWPIEVAAGCDVNDFRARYPELGLMGGIDKRQLALGPTAIDAELDRIWPAVRKGRYIPDLDHHVPNDVSWSNYAYYAQNLKERAYGTR